MEHSGFPSALEDLASIKYELSGSVVEAIGESTLIDVQILHNHSSIAVDHALVELSFVDSKEPILPSKSLTDLLAWLGGSFFEISSGGFGGRGYLAVVDEIVRFDCGDW